MSKHKRLKTIEAKKDIEERRILFVHDETELEAEYNRLGWTPKPDDNVIFFHRLECSNNQLNYTMLN